MKVKLYVSLIIQVLTALIIDYDSYVTYFDNKSKNFFKQLTF